MIQKVRLYGDPVLRQKAETVLMTKEDLDILNDMWDTMLANSCIGLSAPQIGVSKRLFVINCGGVQIKGGNPEILLRGAETEDMEGSPCIPGIRKPVRRPKKILARYLDESGETREVELKGTPARAFLHELDHHEGILFIDHLKPVQRKLIQRELESLEKLPR